MCILADIAHQGLYSVLFHVIITLYQGLNNKINPEGHLSENTGGKTNFSVPPLAALFGQCSSDGVSVQNPALPDSHFRVKHDLPWSVLGGESRL